LRKVNGFYALFRKFLGHAKTAFLLSEKSRRLFLHPRTCPGGRHTLSFSGFLAEYYEMNM
jgi:hypothetical protein